MSLAWVPHGTVRPSLPSLPCDPGSSSRPRPGWGRVPESTSLAVAAALAVGRQLHRRRVRSRARCGQVQTPSNKDEETPASTLLSRRGQLAATFATLLLPTNAEAKEFTSLGNEAFSVSLPKEFTWTEKGIVFQTNAFEQRVTANEPYGKWTVGVTIDPVVANSLNEVGPPDQIAKKIANIEKAKDGNFSTEVLTATRGDIDGVPADVIEYKCDTSRGFFHYLTRVAIKKGKLYLLCSQALEEQWPKLEPAAREILNSFKLTA